jgi:hypothetical protein
MTKKLEELFDLPQQEETDEPTQEVSTADDIPEYTNALSELPQVRGLESSDKEMDELAEKATKTFDDLMDLGMNVDSRWASEIFNTASSMLGHAITAKNAKVNKKLKMIDLQLKKLRMDQMNKDPDADAETGTGMVLDRNELLKRLLDKDAK